VFVPAPEFIPGNRIMQQVQPFIFAISAGQSPVPLSRRSRGP
jgi:hypothetical protein